MSLIDRIHESQEQGIIIQYEHAKTMLIQQVKRDPCRKSVPIGLSIGTSHATGNKIIKMFAAEGVIVCWSGPEWWCGKHLIATVPPQGISSSVKKPLMAGADI